MIVPIDFQVVDPKGLFDHVFWAWFQVVFPTMHGTDQMKRSMNMVISV